MTSTDFDRLNSLIHAIHEIIEHWPTSQLALAVNQAEFAANVARQELARQKAVEQQHAAHIECARELYCTDELEIDEAPAVSAGDGGVWVAAWVWVYDEQVRGA